MNVGEYCSRIVAFVYDYETPLDASRVMREQNVGDVVIVEGCPEESRDAEEKDGRKIPLGIITDRDIAIEIVAEEVDPSAVAVQDICRKSLVVASESDNLFECIARLKHAGVRRAPVVDESGYLTGIISVDDILEVLAEQFSCLAHLVSDQAQQENLT